MRPDIQNTAVHLQHIFHKFTTKQKCTIAYIRWSFEDVFFFDTQGLFENVTYEMTHTTEKPALSRSWKKTPTAIRVSVSKLYVTFSLWCCSQTEG